MLTAAKVIDILITECLPAAHLGRGWRGLCRRVFSSYDAKVAKAKVLGMLNEASELRGIFATVEGREAPDVRELERVIYRSWAAYRKMW